LYNVESGFTYFQSSFNLVGVHKLFIKYSFSALLYVISVIKLLSEYAFKGSAILSNFGRAMVFVIVLLSQAEFINSTFTVSSQ